MKFFKKTLKNLHKKYFKYKIWFYKEVLSETKPNGKPNILSPTLFIGKGNINIGDNVQFGYFPSPKHYEGYSHIEARNPIAVIEIDDGTMVNNNATIIANMTSIKIGKNCRIGANFQCFDSDFHGIIPEDRDNPNAIKNKDVTIGDNVFIGNNVTILKGVTVGTGSIIGGGGLVASDIPQNSIAVGNPAKVIKSLEVSHE